MSDDVTREDVTPEVLDRLEALLAEYREVRRLWLSAPEADEFWQRRARTDAACNHLAVLLIRGDDETNVLPALIATARAARAARDAEERAERLQRIIDGYDRTPAEARAHAAEEAQRVAEERASELHSRWEEACARSNRNERRAERAEAALAEVRALVDAADHPLDVDLDRLRAVLGRAHRAGGPA